MAWVRQRRQAAVTATPQPVEASDYLNRYKRSLYAMVGTGTVKDQVLDIQQQFGEIIIPDDDVRQLMGVLAKRLNLLFGVWTRVNLRYLNPRDAEYLYDLLFKFVPRTIRALILKSHDEDWADYDAEDQLERTGNMVNEAYTRVNDILASQSDPYYRQLNEMKQLDGAPAVTAITATSRQFPQLAAVRKDVDTALEKLREGWAAASNRANTIEDEFFLEQVANSYVPDAWKMYALVANADEHTREQGADLLLTALRLLQQQLDELTGRSGTNTLDALSAHVSFLQLRGDSPLSLAKGKDTHE